MVKVADRVAGIYRAKFDGIDTAFKVPDRDSGETVIRWRWMFTEVEPRKDASINPAIDTITTPSLTARTNGRKFFTGMLGREPNATDDTDTLVGQVFDVTYGPNQNGRLTIVGVSRVIDGPAVAEAPLSRSLDDTPLTALPNMVTATPAGELP